MKFLLNSLQSKKLFCLILLLTVINSCSTKPNLNNLTGTWRAEFENPGADIPFIFEISKNSDGTFDGVVKNGKEMLNFTSVKIINDSLNLAFEHYDSFLRAEIINSGRIHGIWSKRSSGDRRSLVYFNARKGIQDRFIIDKELPQKNSAEDISGEWGIEFKNDEDETRPGLGVFEQNGNIVTGSVLTTTGDYRYLEGIYKNGVLKLSTFDGARAYLFTAKMDKNGELTGDFYSKSSHSATWIGRKGVNKLPDGFELTTLKNQDELFSFEFPDLNGKIISNKDIRFKNKVLIITIFGSWCPNCNDEAPFLVELYNKYHDKGLEIIGLANEYTGDFKKDREMILKFEEKHNIVWPNLIVGISNKEKTTEALKHFNKILSYPTTVFVDRKGKVKYIHTGFSGPATGVYYEKLKEDFIKITESLLVTDNK